MALIIYNVHQYSSLSGANWFYSPVAAIVDASGEIPEGVAFVVPGLSLVVMSICVVPSVATTLVPNKI